MIIQEGNRTQSGETFIGFYLNVSKFMHKLQAMLQCCLITGIECWRMEYRELESNEIPIVQTRSK